MRRSEWRSRAQRKKRSTYATSARRWRQRERSPLLGAGCVPGANRRPSRELAPLTHPWPPPAHPPTYAPCAVAPMDPPSDAMDRKPDLVPTRSSAAIVGHTRRSAPPPPSPGSHLVEPLTADSHPRGPPTPPSATAHPATSEPRRSLRAPSPHPWKLDGEAAHEGICEACTGKVRRAPPRD